MKYVIYIFIYIIVGFFTFAMSGNLLQSFATGATVSFSGSGNKSYNAGTFGGGGCQNISFSASFNSTSCNENGTGTGFSGTCNGSGSVSFGFDGIIVGNPGPSCTIPFGSGGAFSSISYTTDFSHVVKSINFTIVAGVANNYVISTVSSPPVLTNTTYNNATDYDWGLFNASFTSSDVPIIPTNTPIPTAKPTLTPTPKPANTPTPVTGATPTPVNAPGTYFISGYVYDITSGTPAGYGNATVNVCLLPSCVSAGPGDPQTFLTNSDGSYKFINLVDGNPPYNGGYYVKITPPVNYIVQKPSNATNEYFVTVGTSCNAYTTGATCVP